MTSSPPHFNTDHDPLFLLIPSNAATVFHNGCPGRLYEYVSANQSINQCNARRIIIPSRRRESAQCLPEFMHCALILARRTFLSRSLSATSQSSVLLGCVAISASLPSSLLFRLRPLSPPELVPLILSFLPPFLCPQSRPPQSSQETAAIL